MTPIIGPCIFDFSKPFAKSVAFGMMVRVFTNGPGDCVQFFDTRRETQFLKVFCNHTMLITPQHSAHFVVF